MQRSHAVQRVLQFRHSTIELLVLAVVLAFGINLASAGVADLAGISPRAMTFAGFAAIFAVVLYLVARSGPHLLSSLKLKGVLPVEDSGEFFEIRRYEFSERLYLYLKALRSENKAVYAVWERGRLRDHSDSGPSPRSEARAIELVKEGIEYFILDILSLHLSEYFVSQRQVKDDEVSLIKRESVPQILLENRFLELFSRPMHHREAFQEERESADDGDDEQDDADSVVFAVGADGQIFDRFELVLPRGSTLTRPSAGVLRIATTRFSITFTVEFDRTSTVFPDGFDEYYLGKQFDHVHPFIAGVTVDVRFRWWALLTARGWDYFAWLDSFLHRMEESVSFEEFVAAIGWPTALSTAIAVQHGQDARRAQRAA